MTATVPPGPSPPGGVSQVVFAAGSGTRLRPLTGRFPKALVPVLDVPLIDLALGRDSAGPPLPGSGSQCPSVAWANRFVNVSHRGDLLRAHLEGRPDVTLLDEGDEPLGTSGTLRHLLPDLDETVVTYNCDLVSDVDLAGLISAHASTSSAATLAVARVDHCADLLESDAGLRLVDRRQEDRAGFLFLGAACFSRHSLETIPEVVPLGLTEGLLRPLVEAGEIALWEHDGYARDVGTHERYLRTSIELLGRPDLVAAPGTVSSEGAYVGPGADVQQASLGAGAIVLAGARVGAGATLSECVVWPGEVVPPGLSLRRGNYYDGTFIQL